MLRILTSSVNLSVDTFPKGKARAKLYLIPERIIKPERLKTALFFKKIGEPKKLRFPTFAV